MPRPSHLLHHVDRDGEKHIEIVLQKWAPLEKKRKKELDMSEKEGWGHTGIRVFWVDGKFTHF